MAITTKQSKEVDDELHQESKKLDVEFPQANTSKQIKEDDELSQESTKLDADKLKKLQNAKQYYIELLHEYNEVKDAAQSVFGVLANRNKVTIAEIQNKYLPENLKDP